MIIYKFMILIVSITLISCHGPDLKQALESKTYSKYGGLHYASRTSSKAIGPKIGHSTGQSRSRIDSYPIERNAQGKHTIKETGYDGIILDIDVLRRSNHRMDKGRDDSNSPYTVEESWYLPKDDFTTTKELFDAKLARMLEIKCADYPSLFTTERTRFPCVPKWIPNKVSNKRNDSDLETLRIDPEMPKPLEIYPEMPKIKCADYPSLFTTEKPWFPCVAKWMLNKVSNSQNDSDLEALKIYSEVPTKNFADFRYEKPWRVRMSKRKSKEMSNGDRNSKRKASRIHPKTPNVTHEDLLSPYTSDDPLNLRWDERTPDEVFKNLN